VALGLILVIIWLGWRQFKTSKTTSAESSDQFTVNRADFVRRVVLSGTIEPVESFGVAAPRLSGGGGGQMTVTRLAENGSHVKKGDVLVEFDRQDQIRNELDRQADYEKLVQDIEKKQADQTADLAKDQSELQQAEDAVKSAQAEVQRNEVVSRIDAEKNEQSLKEAQATLQELKHTFALKRSAAKADLRILEIQRDKARLAMEYARNNAKKMLVISPIDGVVVLSSIWKSGQMAEVQVGDQLRTGQSFMQVVNSSAMQVRVKVNQADVGDLRLGQKANIGLDAYPELNFKGSLDRMSPVAVTSTLSDKVRTFSVVFSIDGSDPKLLPDLTARVDVEVERIPNALAVPRDALFHADGKDYVLLRDGSRTRRQEVTVGDKDDYEAVITAGLKDGETVVRTAAAKESQ
jgi:RND family efflux transporter MFP subunit